MVRWVERMLLLALFGLCFAIVALLAFSNPNPWTAMEVSRLTVALNEAAAIGVPHDFLMSKKMRAENFALLEKVESGVELGIEESSVYRKIFQSVLADSQKFLGAFDGELSILNDHAPDQGNNINGFGISGQHDHHDFSATQNFADLLQSLSNLRQASSQFHEIYYANRAQKDLVDLISHMGVAPHTVSVTYVETPQPWPDRRLGAEFDAMVKNFKAAQFQPVNSLPYWAAVDQALHHYDQVILMVQDQIISQTSPWQRRIAGRFNALQTLAPPVDLNRPLRRK
jgi:hypothetical protein